MQKDGHANHNKIKNNLLPDSVCSLCCGPPGLNQRVPSSPVVDEHDVSAVQTLQNSIRLLTIPQSLATLAKHIEGGIFMTLNPLLFWAFPQDLLTPKVFHVPTATMLSSFKMHYQVMEASDGRSMPNGQHCDARVMTSLVQVDLTIGAHLEATKAKIRS